MIDNNILGAFIIIDIDNFKYINDTYGHISGDKVLKLISRAIRNCFRGGDIVLRLGGDEFAIYAVGLETKLACENCCKRFLEELNFIQEDENCLYSCGVSIGCSIYNKSVSSFDRLYENSDDCLYQAKKLGKGRYYIKD